MKRSILSFPLQDLRQNIVRLENSSDSAKLEHTNALKKCSEEGDRALVESAEQFKTKLIVEYQKYETLNEKYKVRQPLLLVPSLHLQQCK